MGRRIVAFAFTGLMLAGVAGCAGKDWTVVQRQVEEVSTRCREARLAGRLPGYVASHDCSAPTVRRLWQEAGHPYMDLVDLWLAHRRAVGERLDAGKLTEAEAELLLAQMRTTLVQEQERRVATEQRRPNWLEAVGAGLMGAGVGLQGAAPVPQRWSDPLRPVQLQMGPITCIQTGGITRCW